MEMSSPSLSDWIISGITSIWITSRFPLTLAILFFLSLYHLLGHYPSIFFKKHGRKHAITGLLYLIWITIGFLDLTRPRSINSSSSGNSGHEQGEGSGGDGGETGVRGGGEYEPWIPYLVYDIILGLLGTILTLFAAFEFQHKNIKNIASGTLDEHATVTYGEMIEHSFYQILNLLQILFIHSMSYLALTTSSTSTTCSSGSCGNGATSEGEQGYGYGQDRNTIFTSIILMDTNHNQQYSLLWTRLFLLFLVTMPWLIRDSFPINRFSDNYTKIDHKSTTLIRILYRIKKYQYVFYKHFLLHGLNITIALTGLTFGHQYFFRLYWLLLNLSYVMEFFLQTLVKKGVMKQEKMLLLQKVLMTASTIAALSVLRYVNIWIAMISLIYNFIHRKHDVYNTMIVCLGYIAFCYTFYPNNIVYS